MVVVSLNQGGYAGIDAPDDASVPLPVRREECMNVVMWVLAGGVLGWLSYMFLNAIGAWGAIVSSIIGAVGGFAGGNVFAPMLGAVREAPNEFSLFSMAVALASAAGLLALVNLVPRRPKS